MALVVPFSETERVCNPRPFHSVICSFIVGRSRFKVVVIDTLNREFSLNHIYVVIKNNIITFTLVLD